MSNNNRVSVQEQIERGILQPSNSKYVPARVETQAIAHRPTVEVMPQNDFNMAVVPTATAYVEMKTSAKDRAQGFIIASMPRTFAFSLAVTLAAITLGGVTLGAAFVILFSVFSVVEIASYVFTLAISAEGVASYEARQKWAVIREEQRERWNHYKRISGGDNNG